MSPLLLLLVIIFGICSTQTVPVSEFLHYHDLNGASYTVAADERSFIINGERTMILGGSIHYPRLSTGQWKDILTKMFDDGLNSAQVYVFWNIHEPEVRNCICFHLLQSLQLISYVIHESMILVVNMFIIMKVEQTSLNFWRLQQKLECLLI